MTGPADDGDEEEEERPEPCVLAPATESSTEELRWISRTVRETRANLMVLAGAPARMNPLYATLHHPQLWLLEAILAEPKRARAADRAWLGRNLLRTFVDLRAGRRDQVAGLDLAAALQRARLTDEGGRRYRLLYLARREDERGAVYRLAFETARWSDARAPRRLALSVALPPPPHGPGGRITAHWALSGRALPSFDRQPIAAGLVPARTLRQARRALLLGEVKRARALAARAARCPGSWKAAADALTVALDSQAVVRLERAAPLAASARGADEPGRPGAAAGDGPGPGPLKQRRALVSLLDVHAELGLVDPAKLAAAGRVLDRAGDGASPTMVGRLLVAFDRALAGLLAAALDPGAPLTPTPRQGRPRSRVVGEPARPRAPSGARAWPELARRVERASAGLMPRYVGRAARPGASCGARLCLAAAAERAEIFPRLVGRQRGMEVVATARRRLAGGWLHPGLPAGLKLRVVRLDDSPAYWAAEVGRAFGGKQLATLARRLLRHELTRGDGPRATTLAAAGLARVDGKRAWKELRRVIERGSPIRAAAALRGLYGWRGGEARSLAGRYARGSDLHRRAAAVALLGLEAGPVVPAVRAALDAAEPEVVKAALAALLPRGRAIDRARRWLTNGKGWQRRAVLEQLARTTRPLPRLAGALLAGLRGEATPPELVGALRAVPAGRAVAALERLYATAPKLRRAVLEVSLAGRARGKRDARPLTDRAWLKLWQRARQEQDLALRRLAVRGLSRLARPPRPVLEQALGDEDAVVRFTAHVGLARLGRSASLLALGGAARGSCAQRAVVLEPLSRALDASSRAKLLTDALHSGCGRPILALAWRLVLAHQPKDEDLLRVGLGHPARWLRVAAAVTTLGGRGDAALGRLPWD